MRRASGEIWNKRLISLLREMAGVEGKYSGDAPIVSMGTTGPPLVETPNFIVDYIVSDGAQVTRPSIDPYREPIETHIYLFGGAVRFSIPLMISGVEDLPLHQQEVIASVSYRMGVLLEYRAEPPEFVRKRKSSALLRGEVQRSENVKGVVSVEFLWLLGGEDRKAYLARVPAKDDEEFYTKVIRSGFNGLVIDEDVEGGESELEVAVATADTALKEAKDSERSPMRWDVAIIAVSDRIRGSHDIYKLVGLGADIVGIRTAWRIAVDHSTTLTDDLLSLRLENFILAIQREIKLLAGAAGVSSLESSVTGNRELFRAVELPSALREKLGVKGAGMEVVH